MQVCTPCRQPRQHPTTQFFLQAGCPSWRPTNSVKALKDLLEDNYNEMSQRQTSASSPQLMSCWGFSRARWHKDDYNTINHNILSALTLLVGWQERHLACKNWVVRYWCGYLSGTRCKLFACGAADATANPSSLASLKSRMVYLSGASLPTLSYKKGH